MVPFDKCLYWHSNIVSSSGIHNVLGHISPCLHFHLRRLCNRIHPRASSAPCQDRVTLEDFLELVGPHSMLSDRVARAVGVM